MATCGNCGKSLGCSCQKKKASDGKQCCSSCIKGYEASLSKSNAETETDNKNIKPIITSVDVKFHGITNG